MALSLLCGGLGVASASLEVVDQSGTSGTVTIYTKDEVDNALTAKGAATDVASNKTDITNLKSAVGDAGSGLTKDVADQKADIATNRANINNLDGKLANLTDTVSDKADEATVTTALGDKANTDLSNLTADGVNKIKNTMSADMDLKADKTYVDNALENKADTGTVTTLEGRVGGVEGRVTTLETKVGDASGGLVKDVADLKAQGNTLNTELGNKANQSDLDAAKNRITTNEGNITDLQKKTAKLSADGTELKGMTTVSGTNVEAGALKVTGAISDGAGVNTTLADIKASMTQTATNKGDIAALQTTTGKQQTAIDDLKKRTTKIDYDTATDTTSVNGMKVGQQVDMGGKDLTHVGTINGIDLGTKEGGNYISPDGSIWGNMKTVDTQVKTNADNIETNKNAITALDTKVGKIDDRTGGIDRNLEDTQTTIEGSVKVDKQGNVKDVNELSAKKITTTGDATIGGALGVTGETTLDGALTAKGEATFKDKVTVEKDLTVNGKLNVDEISMKNDSLDPNGDQHHSATTITADGISNNAEVTDKNGVKTESKFTHDKEGSTTYAYQGDAANWKKSTSNVTADGVENVAEDSKGNNNTFTQTSTDTKNTLTDKEGNTSSTRQDSKGIYGYAKDKDGNKSYTKQEGNRIAESVIGQDGKETKSEMTSTDITNTAKDGTITSDAKDIVNKATGNISNSSATMDTTVTGKATESYGELETEVKGNEKHTVKGDQTNEVDGKQINTIKNGQENIISGGQTNTITGGQINNITGDQTTNVSGTQTTTATDINRNASSGMIDTIDNDYGTNTETKVAGKTTTDVSIKGTEEKGQYIRGANESRDYLIKGTLKNSETKTVEKTSTEITDGNGKTSATIQDVNNLAGSVTNGTETGVSGIHANDNSVSIDSIVTDENKYSAINQKKGSIQSTVVDGTNFTVILQDKDNVTIASSNGTVAIGGKDIVNNAQDTITNTAGTSITNQVKDSKVTTDVDGTTFENKTAAVSDGGTTTTKINGNRINTGRVDANELGVSDKDDQGNTADFSVKAGEGIKGSVTDKDGNKTYTTVTATENSFQVQDKDGKIKNHQVNTKDKSENTITNGDKTNTVTSTADGTTFNNSKANTVFEGGMYTDTTIKGNTITTGKVTMDYADVMRDLGVRGNATVDKDMTVKGNTTLGEAGKDTTLTVNSKATFNEKATFEKGAEVKNGLTVSSGGLNVTGESTFNDKVTMKNGLDVTGGVASDSFTVKGTDIKIDSSGINAGGTVISNVADGSISEGSKDAVNGGQLYQVKNDLEGKVNKVGANAAAMANLHPMEFDPDSKWNIAAAMGNYGSETATAIGAFYRPNEDVMVNFSTAFGTGENMVGGGVSVRLGKGSNKLSREESNALKAQVNDLTARMDALLSVLNPNMSKDFPDVPENHWAYEAVSRLAGNDIVQGYPDGEFHGERTMTRYEMAEIIYNALSRGAEAEKELVEEFKPELQAMAASEKATAERAEG